MPNLCQVLKDKSIMPGRPDPTAVRQPWRLSLFDILPCLQKGKSVALRSCVRTVQEDCSPYMAPALWEQKL